MKIKKSKGGEINKDVLGQTGTHPEVEGDTFGHMSMTDSSLKTRFNFVVCKKDSKLKRCCLDSVFFLFLFFWY